MIGGCTCRQAKGINYNDILNYGAEFDTFSLLQFCELDAGYGSVEPFPVL